MSSKWFDSMEPSLSIIAGETRCAGCLCTSSGWFKHIEPHQTYSNHNTTEIARCGGACHMSSGWFDCTEPSLYTTLQGKQVCRVLMHYTLHTCFPCSVVYREGSVQSNHPELM